MSGRRMMRPSDLDNVPDAVPRKPEAVPASVKNYQRQIEERLTALDFGVEVLALQNRNVGPEIEAAISKDHQRTQDRKHLDRELQRSDTQICQSEYELVCLDIERLQGRLTHSVTQREADVVRLMEVASENKRMRAELSAIRAERAELRRQHNEE
eukprot:5645331-Prymnesium_polylepis.1